MHRRHLFWRQMWPRYTSVRYVLSFLMLESICMWFTVALPFFRRQATFYSVCTRWVEGGENSKKKTTNIMRYSQKTAAAAHVSQIQAFMHAEERASISVSLGDQSASVFISFLCAVPEKLTPTDDAHLDHMCTLRLESFFTSEASLLVKSPPPRISTENTTIAVVGDDTYRTIWKCVCEIKVVPGLYVTMHLRTGGNAAPTVTTIYTHTRKQTQNAHWPPVLVLHVS